VVRARRSAQAAHTVWHQRAVSALPVAARGVPSAYSLRSSGKVRLPAPDLISERRPHPRIVDTIVRHRLQTPWRRRTDARSQQQKYALARQLRLDSRRVCSHLGRGTTWTSRPRPRARIHGPGGGPVPLGSGTDGRAAQSHAGPSSGDIGDYPRSGSLTVFACVRPRLGVS
jgi:hypothetical protein